MSTRRIFFLSITAAILALPVVAQSGRDGLAVVGRYGEFPPEGLFAGANAYPLNSMVDVTNEITGESVRVVVVSRVDEPGIFMLLSDDAARALGIRRGESTSVSARPVRLPGLTAVDPNLDLPFHPDPDINPAAGLGDPNRALRGDLPRRDDPDPRPEIALVSPEEPRADDPVTADPAPEPREEPPQEPPQVDLPPRDIPGTPPGAPPGPEIYSVLPEIVLPPEEVSDPPVLDRPLIPGRPPRRAPLGVVLALPEIPREEPSPETQPLRVEVADSLDGEDPLRARILEIDRALGDDMPLMVALPEKERPHKELPAEPREEVATPDLLIPPRDLPSPAVAVALPLAEPPGESEDPVLVAEPEDAGEPDPEDVPEIAAVEELPPEEPELPELVQPREEEGLPLSPDAVITLEPAEFRSPDYVPESEPEQDPIPPGLVAALDQEFPKAEIFPEAEPEAAPGELPLVDRLQSGAHYVQVAAMKEAESALRAVRILRIPGEELPLAVTFQDNGARPGVYRVFVGPLSVDERGTVLQQVRGQGFRDAFLRHTTAQP